MAQLKMLTALLMMLVALDVQSIPMEPLSPMDFVHKVMLDRVGDVILHWTPNEDDVIFEVQAATTGYIGVGFSPGGGMRNADIIVGWVDDSDGEVYLHDRYATGNRMPVVDKVQNVELLGGFQNDSHTTLRYRRPWDTCDDQQDMILSEDTMRVIWAYSNSDPANENAVSYHSTNRGSKSLYLKEPQFVLPEFGNDVKTWELLAPKVALPNEVDTLYWCRLYKVPDLPLKAHMIGYVPVVQEGNELHVHHIVVYECFLPESEKHFEKWLNIQGAQCHSKNMPVSWNKCRTPIIAWAIGSDGEMFPDHVGFPIGEVHGGATYFMMEMHYDNPNLRQDVFDSSGLKLFYTENTREQEAGYMIIGADVSPNHIVPPGQADWLTVGHCAGECTEKSIPPNGINVFQGLLHAHLLGRNLKLRQIRGGKEIKNPFEDMGYDFNYQQTRVLQNEMKIMPGDSFIMECGYDSTGRKVPTFGGLGTSEEMCVTFLAYYPRSNTGLGLCSSRPTLQNIYELFGIEEIYDKSITENFFGDLTKDFDEEKDNESFQALNLATEGPKIEELKLNGLFNLVVAKAPAEYLNVTLYDIVHDKNTWKDPALIAALQNVSANGRQAITCFLNNLKTPEGIPKEMDYPNFVALEPEASICDANLAGGPSGKITPAEEDNLIGGGAVVGGGGSPSSSTLPAMSFMHDVNLDQEGNYMMLWTPKEDMITFEVQVATTGYVGLGFSPNGAMRGSDILLGWVDDRTGEVFLSDRYGTGNEVPKVDENQDVELLAGMQNDTHTVLRFNRKWNTCDDAEDMELTDNTVRVIWAMGASDPEEGDPMGFRYHAERGVRSMYLKEPLFELPEFGDDVLTWEVRSPNVELPKDIDTLYWCKIFKMPNLLQKAHMIGYQPVISSDNLEHVHHILLYECHLPESDRHFEKFLDIDGAQCFGANMPPSWKSCTSPLVAWAIGGGGDIFDEHVGFPIGEEHGGATYFMMEMHYDNPNLRQGVIDNSGLRMFYTYNLRQYDAGILMFGHDVSPAMIVPPEEDWLTIGHCSSQCTDSILPEDGINVFAAILHSHLLGRSISLRHLRDNIELPVLMRDTNYDFNFQETRGLKEEVKVYPRDSFITECGYDATQRKVPTFGGFGTQEEMCLAFLYYYPRVDLSLCTSAPTMKNLFYALGIEGIYTADKPPSVEENLIGNGIDEEAEKKLVDMIKSGENADNLKKINIVELFRGIIIKAPLKYQNQSLYDILVSEDTWKNKEMIELLQDVVVNGNHTARCDRKSNGRAVQAESKPTEIPYPTFEPLPPSENSCGSAATKGGMTPLVCPPQVPSCNRYRWPNNVLGHRPGFF